MRIEKRTEAIYDPFVVERVPREPEKRVFNDVVCVFTQKRTQQARN